jgi:hypothetical protein
MWPLFASRTRSTPMPPRHSPRRRAARPRLESLEGRVVLTVAFDSVLGVGNDTAAITVHDNAVDAAGNHYVTGFFNGTVDFDPLVDRPDGSDALTTRGSSDAFVAKYAPDNTLVWARRMGGASASTSLIESGAGVAVDGSGNVFIGGHFTGQADFGSVSLTSAGDMDVFVAKLDAGGNVLWAKGWGGPLRDSGYAGIAVDASGNVISAGTLCNGTTDGGFSTVGFEVRKYGPTGALLWTDRVSGTSTEVTDVATGNDGAVYVSGDFRGTVDFNPDARRTDYASGATNGANGYVLKLTSAGAFGWVAPFVAKTAASPASRAVCTEVAVDPAGNVVVGGGYSGQVDFNPSSSVESRLPNITTSGDGFVARLSPGGSLGWATPLGGATIQSLAVDGAGGVYVSGNFSETFIPGFGLPATATRGGTDAFATALSSSGAVEWAATFGGTGADSAEAISVDAAGTVYLAGYFLSTVDFDPDPLGTHELTNPAKRDLFLLKLRRR